MIKCPKCGWEYPDSYPNNYCKFCKTTISELRRCTVCMQKKPESEFIDSRCKACTTDRVRMYRRMDPETNHAAIRTYKLKQGIKASNRLEEFKSMSADDVAKAMNKAKTYTLTEDDWLKACRYFGGCAFCGDEQIETRTYFVPFKEGGKYNALNMLPACATCGLKLSSYTGDNPFILFSNISPKHIRFSEERLEQIMQYFRSLV